MDVNPATEPVTPDTFGPYEVFERLGIGGMAQVHRAKKRGPAGFERSVALKRMLTHLAEDASFVESFIREAKVGLHHARACQARLTVSPSTTTSSGNRLPPGVSPASQQPPP